VLLFPPLQGYLVITQSKTLRNNPAREEANPELYKKRQAIIEHTYASSNGNGNFITS